MEIEHVGMQVEHPAAMAEWYVNHLGFVIKRASDAPVVVRFLADPTESVMIEIYRNPAADVPDYATMHPLVLHLAFVCDDPPAASKRLVEAGATIVTNAQTMPNGDVLAMLRDPWGFSIQLCRRRDPMLRAMSS